MVKAISGVVAASAALLLAGHAMAQARDNYFARDRNISVRERARPGYQALGLPLGAFIAFPKVELGVQANSNIYGQPTDAKSDAIGIINPEIDLVSRWARNSLSLFARTATNEYVRYTTEDTTNWQLGGKGQLDLGDSAVNAGGDYGYLAQPRTASIGANLAYFATIHPVEYYQTDANANIVHTFNRLQVQGGVTYASSQFQNGVNSSGGSVVENTFNNERTVVFGKAAYAVSPDTAIYASVGYNTINYPIQVITAGTTNRNSSGETYDVGANFDLTQLIRGDVEVGYLNQSYTGAGFSQIGGFHALGKVEWFPTQLTTVTFTGQRDVDPAILVGSPSVIVGAVGAQVDHELLRNVILTGVVHYQDNNYQGIVRDDRIGELTLSGDYLLNRRIGVHLAYDYLTQDSTGTARGVNFNDNRVTLSTTLQY